MHVTWDANNLIIEGVSTARSKQFCSGTRGLVLPEETAFLEGGQEPRSSVERWLPGQSVWQVFLICSMLERDVL